MLKRVKFSTKKIVAILVPVMFIIAILAASGIANAAVIVKYNADELHEGDIVSPGLFLDLGSRQEVNYNFVGKDSGTFSEGTILIPDCGEVASKWMVSSSAQMSGDQTKWNITFVPVYKIKIANYEVTYNNKDDILGDGSISYNPTTNTLTMDNADFQINAIASSIDYFGTETLNIVLVGDNTSFTTGPQYGISSTAGINISGEGSLELYSDVDSIHIFI